MVSTPCGNTNNSEVISAIDGTNGYIYDAWIGCGGIGFSRSIDGGATFQSALLMPGSSDAANSTTFTSTWDPSVAVAPDGIVYVAYMREDYFFSNRTNLEAPNVAVSTDHGATFSRSSPVFQPRNNTFSDRDFIAVAQDGTLYLTWDYAPDASLVQILCSYGGSCYFRSGDFNIVIVHSADKGHTWSSMSPVSPGYPFGGAVAAPLLVEPDGTIDILYTDYNVTASGHVLERGFNYFTSSSDGGKSWATPVSVDAGRSITPSEWWIDGALSRDDSGILYATFDTQNSTSDTAWLSYSRDQGHTWSQLFQLNQDNDSSVHIIAQSAGGPPGIAFTSWMSNYTGSWQTYVRLFSVNGTASPQIIISDQNGINGVWGGDTLGISYLGRGKAEVSWGYGVNLYGNVRSEIYSATEQLIYNESFFETGLPSGTLWHVTMNGTSKSSQASSINFSDVFLGNYVWNASNPIANGTLTRFFSNDSSGTFFANATQIHFDYATQYLVSFSNQFSTLPRSEWYDQGQTIPLNAQSMAGYQFANWSSTSARITFQDPSSPSTLATVNGPGTITANYKPIQINGSNSGSWNIFDTILVVAVVSSLIVIAVFVVISSRRSRKEGEKNNGTP